MADSRISDLAALTGANIAAGDLFEVVDVSDTSMAATGTNKKTTSDDVLAKIKAGLGIVTIASGSLPAAAVLDITSIPATYAALILRVTGASSATATRHPRVQVDSDNGASFDTTAGNYVGFIVDEGALIINNGEASLCGPGAGDQAAATTFDIDIVITGYQGGARLQAQFSVRSSNGAIDSGLLTYIGGTTAINALRILWNGSGNFDAGTYALYGVN